MGTDVATVDGGTALESVILKGDISALTPIERVQYYKAVCDSVGLNPLTQPLAYMSLSGRTVLYAKKDATDQLRALKGVSVVPNSLRTSRLDDVYIVAADFVDKDGRTDSATGVVTIANLKGDALANAMMKAETKCKRRGTLSICGLGLLDESELDTIHDEQLRRLSDPAVIQRGKDEVAAIDKAVKGIWKPDAASKIKDAPTPIHHYSETRPPVGAVDTRPSEPTAECAESGTGVLQNPDDRALDADLLKQEFNGRLAAAATFKTAAGVREEVLNSDLPQAFKDGFEITFKAKFAGGKK